MGNASHRRARLCRREIWAGLGRGLLRAARRPRRRRRLLPHALRHLRAHYRDSQPKGSIMMRHLLFAMLAITVAACGTQQAVVDTSSGTISTPVVSLSPTSPTQQMIDTIEKDGPAKLAADLDAAATYAQAQ